MPVDHDHAHEIEDQIIHPVGVDHTVTPEEAFRAIAERVASGELDKEEANLIWIELNGGI